MGSWQRKWRAVLQVKDVASTDLADDDITTDMVRSIAKQVTQRLAAFDGSAGITIPEMVIDDIRYAETVTELDNALDALYDWGDEHDVLIE